VSAKGLRASPREAAAQLASGLAAFGLADHPLKVPRLLATALAAGGVSVAGALLAAGRVWGEAAAVVDAAGVVSYRSLAGRAERLATALAPFGARQVALLLDDDRDFLIALAAAGLTGARVTPVSDRLGLGRLRALGADNRFDLVLHADSQVLEAQALAGSARLAARDQWAGLVGAVRGRPPPRRGRASRLVMLTSGSTGRPRAVPIKARPGAPLTAIALAGPTGVRHGQPALICPPLSHGFGLQVAVLCLVCGAPMVLASAIGQERTRLGLAGAEGYGAALARLAGRWQVGTVFAVPTQLRRLAAQLRAAAPGLEVPPLPSVRRVVSGSELLDAATVETLNNYWGPVVVNYYGSTETGTVTVAGPQVTARHPGAVGRPAAGTRIWVVGDDGEVSRPGRIGRIRIASPLAQLSDPGTAGAPAGVWTTSDLGYCDGDGLLHIVGRSDGLVRAGGEFSHPQLVADLLAGLPGVAAARAWSESDPDFGGRIAAAVELAEASAWTAGALRAEVRSRLGPAHTPVRIETNHSNAALAE
jgi:fatty-acyl-CoA synthase